MKCPYCEAEVSGVKVSVQSQPTLWGAIIVCISACTECDRILGVQTILEVARGPGSPGADRKTVGRS